VSATTLTRAVFGDALAYDVPALTLGHLTELPWILFGGVLFGLVGAGFNALFKTVARQGTRLPEWLRPLLGGLLVGLCGLAVPAVLGIGDDTVDHLLRGEDLAASASACPAAPSAPSCSSARSAGPCSA